jgi:hypothetical protein
MMSYITEYWGVLDEITTPAMAWEGTCSDYGLVEQWADQAKAAKAMLNIVQGVSA